MANSKNGTPTRRQASPSTTAIPKNSTDASPDTDVEGLEPAVEILRPLLRDPAQASEAVARVATAGQFFRGPIPTPDLFRGYNDAGPGSAREILDNDKRGQ